MKLHIMSDLHLEMHADGGAELIRGLDATGVDVLVLAGDITMARHYEDLESVFRPLAKKYRRILYVAGNHEYYRSSPGQGKRVMHDFSLIKDFEPWVYEQNAAFEQVVAERLQATDVVLTHHLPAPQSTPVRFARSIVNAFFLCDMTSTRTGLATATRSALAALERPEQQAQRREQHQCARAECDQQHRLRRGVRRDV